MSVKELLAKEIEDGLAILKDTEMNSDEYKTEVDSLVKLIDRFNTMTQNELSNAEKARAQANEQALNDARLKLEREIKFEQLYAEKAAQEREYVLKVKQAEDEKKDRFIRNIMTGAGIIIPTGVTIWGVLKSFEFEKEGTVTTILGRGLINKLLPRK